MSSGPTNSPLKAETDEATAHASKASRIERHEIIVMDRSFTTISNTYRWSGPRNEPLFRPMPSREHVSGVHDRLNLNISS